MHALDLLETLYKHAYLPLEAKGFRVTRVLFPTGLWERVNAAIEEAWGPDPWGRAVLWSAVYGHSKELEAGHVCVHVRDPDAGLEGSFEVDVTPWVV